MLWFMAFLTWLVYRQAQKHYILIKDGWPAMLGMGLAVVAILISTVKISTFFGLLFSAQGYEDTRHLEGSDYRVNDSNQITASEIVFTPEAAYNDNYSGAVSALLTNTSNDTLESL